MSSQVNGGSGEPLGATGRAERSHDLAQPKPSPTSPTMLVDGVILAENQAKPAKPGQNQPVSSTGLTWEKPKPGTTGVKTLCGRYSCSKTTDYGKTTYEVWVLVPATWFRQLAVGLSSFDEAKRIAEEHARKAL